MTSAAGEPYDPNNNQGFDGSLDGHAPHPWNKEEFPHPILSAPPLCRVQGPSTICDPEGILTYKQKSDLNIVTRKLKSSLKCYCNTNCTVDTKGISVGIALAHSIYRPYSLEPKNNTAAFAYYLREKWNLGICGNDILILIVDRDEQWYPSLGVVARQIIPTRTLDRIYQEAQDAFARREFFEGLSNMLSTLFEELWKIENTKPATEKSIIDATAKKPSKWPLILGVIIVIILCLLLLSVAVWMIILRRKKRQEGAREPEEVTFREKGDLHEGDGDNSNERNAKSRFSWNPLKSAKYSFRKGNKTRNNHTTSSVEKTEYTTIAASVGRKESQDFHDTETAIEDDGITRVGGGGAPVYQETTLA